MNKKKIDKLIEASYKNDQLDRKKVYKIASLIGKSDLRRYINGLKLSEKKKSIIISTPVNYQGLEKFKKFFPNKKIILKEDPSLMLGVEIIDNDVIYDFTLAESFNKIKNYIEQNYD